jgi:hypothetical protein
MENININSGQVEIIGPFGRVYLYTHDYAKNLVAFVHESLSRRVRWDDPDYLSRIIFCSMIPYNEINNEQGFGIGTQLYVDINLLITINTVDQTIEISSFGSGVDNIKMAIEDFVDNFYKNAEF